MPAARGKKTRTREEIPSAPGDPERKRVLNVLAQRRYRQRQRERVAVLEARAKNQRPTQLGGYHEVFPGPPRSSEFPSSDQNEDMMRSSDSVCFLGLGLEQDSLDWPLLQECPDAFYYPRTNPPTTTHTHTPAPPASSPTFSFPFSSDAQVQVPILDAMRAFASIFTALNILQVIYNPTYLHILPNPPTLALTHLPCNLHPTPAQLTIPHHPVLDALPWPSVREKLICMLSLPSMFRPPIAQDDSDDPCGTGQAKAVQRLMHDLDDLQEGARVYGNTAGWDGCSELSEKAWEMGECFYRNWWFCVDPGAVVATNRRRRARGVRALRL